MTDQEIQDIMHNDPEAVEVLDGIYPGADLILAAVKSK